MKPFFSYFGSKNGLARYYPAPTTDTIIEPFAGSAGYATRYGAGKRVLLCDPSPYVCGVWDYLIRVSPEELLRLPDLLPGVSVHELDIPQEAQWLVGYLVFKGNTNPNHRMSAWSWENRDRAMLWGGKMRERLAVQVPLIRNWRIRNCSYHELMTDVDSATWFIDPPYYGQNGYGKYNSKQIDYAHLADWCRSLPGQKIVCERDGAAWLPFTPLRQMQARNLEKKGTAMKTKPYTEVVWTSDDVDRGAA